MHGKRSNLSGLWPVYNWYSNASLSPRVLPSASCWVLTFPSCSCNSMLRSLLSLCNDSLCFGFLLMTAFQDCKGSLSPCPHLSLFLTLPANCCMQSSARHNYCKQWGSRRGPTPVNMLNQKETAGQSVPCFGIKNG